MARRGKRFASCMLLHLLCRSCVDRRSLDETPSTDSMQRPHLDPAVELANWGYDEEEDNVLVAENVSAESPQGVEILEVDVVSGGSLVNQQRNVLSQDDFHESPIDDTKPPEEEPSFK